MEPWLHAGLVIVDVQVAIDAPYWAALGARNNPEAETVIARMLQHWRDRKLPIIHIRHSSTSTQSSYHVRGAGFAFKYPVLASKREVVLTKHCNSAFINTALHAELKQLRCDRLVVCGVTTNHSIDATVRHGASLGFSMRVVADACAAFPLKTRTGELISAQAVHDIFLANLQGEYCEVVESNQLFA